MRLFCYARFRVGVSCDLVVGWDGEAAVWRGGGSRSLRSGA